MLFYFKREIKSSILTFFLTIFFFNSSLLVATDFGKNIGAGAAIAKLPLGILADYYDCQDERGKALIFESLYLAAGVADTAIKMSRKLEDVSVIEIGFSVYDLIRFCSKLREFSKSSPSESSKSECDDQKNNLYNALKYIGLIGDSAFSIAFSLDSSPDNESYRYFYSLFGSSLKLIAACTDVKHNEFYLKNFLLAGSVGAVSSVFLKILFEK